MIRKKAKRKFNHKIKNLPESIGINSKREIELRTMLITIGFEISQKQSPEDTLSISRLIERISQCKIDDVEKMYITWEMALAAIRESIEEKPSSEPPIAGYM